MYVAVFVSDLTDYFDLNMGCFQKFSCAYFVPSFIFGVDVVKIYFVD